MHLIEFGNLRPLLIIEQGRVDASITCFALHGKLGAALLQNDKIDFPFVRIAQKTQIHAIAFRVFHEMAILQKVRGD